VAVSERVRAVGLGAALIALIGWGASLPLRDVLAYPDRISVLPNLQTDAAAYHAIGLNLATTGSLEALPPRHPPGWVALLAALYTFTGPSFVAGKIVSWLAFLASIAMCAYLARHVYGATAAWIAALLVAWSPALRGYIGTLQYEVVTGTLLLMVLVLALRTVRATTANALYGWAALTGAAGAVLILTRETFAVIVPLVAFWILRRRLPLTRARAAWLTFAIVVGAAVMPAVLWSAVQSVRYGGLITISEKGPLVVELGYNPRANGTYNAPLVGIGQPTGLAFVRAYPQRTLVLAGRKILYFWGVLRDGWNVPRPAAVWLWRASTGLIPLQVAAGIARGGWLLFLFAVSFLVLGRNGLRAWWILPAVVLTLMAVHVAVLSSHRFAVPVLPVVFVLVSGPLAAAIRFAAPSLRTPVVAAATLGLALIVVALQYQQWPLEVQYEAADLDGLEADNVVDPVLGRPARVADAKRGLRPVVLLPDEYLPAGSLTTAVTVRRIDTAPPGIVPAIRLALVELDGTVACARDVSSDELPQDRFAAIAVPCRLSRDTAATLAIYSLGVTDLALGDVQMKWRGR
jgi:dolichyl-phosphate-mannose-protein mannosyltransferase